MPPQPGQRSGSGDAEQIGISKFIVFSNMDKMNTKVTRQNLDEKQVAWMENLQPIAGNDLKVVPAPNTALTTVSGKTVSRQFFANIGSTDYIIFFATDGSATAVNAQTGAQTVIAGTGTFSTTPDMTVFSSSRILIMDTVGFYSTWDGTLFVGGAGGSAAGAKGAISPNVHITSGGAGYTSAPTVSFTGGHGGNAGGATATATIAGGSVISVTVTNAGTLNNPSDAITVVFTGGGFTTVATATVVVWPQVSGNSITIFGGRVWWSNGRILNFTGTGASTGQTYDDLNPADAAGSTTITDADLVHNITGLRSLNNFLFIFGDQSIKQIGSITVSSSVTLFTILTLASDIGTSFLMTILSYNRLVVFANKQGVYGIFGATVQKISDDLDGIFQLTNFSQIPSAALNEISNIHCYLLLLSYNDPVAGQRAIICVYQTNKWFVVSQGSLLSICTVPLATTTQFETFGSTGADVTQLLQNPANPVSIKLITSMTPHGNPIQNKQVIMSGICLTSTTAQTLNMTVDTENGTLTYSFSAANVMTWVNNGGQIVTFQNNSFTPVTFLTGGFEFPFQSTEGYGKFIGNTVTGSVMNLSINLIANEYQDASLWRTIP
jgi:hypothetical protein